MTIDNLIQPCTLSRCRAMAIGTSQADGGGAGGHGAPDNAIGVVDSPHVQTHQLSQYHLSHQK